MVERFWSQVLDDSSALILSILLLGGLVGLAEFLHRTLRWPSQISRRIVHAGTGLYVVAIPYLFANAAAVYLLGVSFVVINGFTSTTGRLRGMHPENQETWGTVAFPLALIGVLPFCWEADRQYILQTAFLILAIADPLAAMAGESLSRRRVQIGAGMKSPLGSATFFGAAWILTLAGLMVFDSVSMDAAPAWRIILITTLVALVSTAVEALGGRGWDNFFIVVSVCLILLLWQIHAAWLPGMGIGVASGILFGLLSWKLEFLTRSGAIAGGLFAATLIGLGGWGWAAPGFTFFFLSSLLSKRATARSSKRPAAWSAKRATIRPSKRTTVRHGPPAEAAPTGARRDASQVYANGAIAWLLIVAYAAEPHAWIYWGFVGSLAAATADTWASEIGPLLRGRPRMILSGRPVPAGTSGAVSWAGTLAGVLGAVIIWAVAWWTAPEPAGLSGAAVSFISVVGAGITGSVVDSVAGATIQAGFADHQTGRIVDEHGGNGEPMQHVRGWRRINNNVVNALCTGAGAAAAILLILLLQGR